MNININNCIIEIDDISTREYYNLNRCENDCECSGCKNFRQYTPCFSDKIIDFFRKCGIDDMRTIAEIIPLATIGDGMVYYGGFYHIVGRIIRGNKIVMTIPCIEPKKDEKGKVTGTEKVGEKLKTYTNTDKLKIDDHFSVYFSDLCGLLPKSFPSDAIQLEIEAYIPWIIEDKNTY